MIVVVYVDDLVIIGGSMRMIESTKKYLTRSFDMTDLRLLHYYLGIDF